MLKLLQKDLEAKIITELQTAFTAAELTDVNVGGAWQPTAQGLVKWVETDEASAAFVNVAVGTPGRDTFSDPRSDLAAKITLFVRYELDPTGEMLVKLAHAIQSTIDAWQGETYQQAFTRFDLSYFSVDDLSVQAGSSPNFSGDKVAVEWPITLSGSFIITN